LAFLEILAGDSAFITLNVSPTQQIKIVAEPITFTSPVSTPLPDEIDDDFEEMDESVLAGRDLPTDDPEGKRIGSP
jgi:hypothetical protein